MSYRVAINGYGRIGQCILRAVYERRLHNLPSQNIEIVAINELSDIDTIAYLTRYDTSHGRFPLPVKVAPSNKLEILDDLISIYRHETLSSLPWKAEEIDLVMECTGAFGTRKDAEIHIQSGSQKVLLAQPADVSVDKTIVYGVNHHTLTQNDRIVSNASCTTNAIVPVIKVLHEAFDIQCGSLTTIHSAMNDQPTIDAYHNHDLRRTRSAMHNLVPVDTGLAKGIERLLPEMSGRFTANAIRVPTINVSAIDLSVYVAKDTDINEVNRVLQEASIRDGLDVFAYTEEPIASSDFNHDPHSSIIDGSQTKVSGKKLIKVLTWFDNEWAFACRMLDVAEHWLSS